MVDARTSEREIRSLLKASRELRCDNLLMLTEDQAKTEQASWMGLSGTVQYLPLHQWLAGDP